MNTAYVPLAYEEWLGEPNSGDFDQGAGTSTSQLQNPNVTIPKNQAKAVPGAPWQQSPGFWIMLFLLLAGTKIIIEKAGEKSEFASVRIGLENWWIVGVLAATFIFANRISSYLLKSYFPTNQLVIAYNQFFGSI